MPGLLGDGFEDPRSSAIMALSGGLLRGDFGGGLLGANDAFAQAKQNAFRSQLAQMQMQEAQQKMEDERRRRAFLENLPDPQMAASQQALAGGGGPTMANAARMPQVSPTQQLMFQGVRAGAIPLGDYLKATAPKQLEFSKIDPKDYTPDSLRQAAATGDYSQLVPVRKLDVVNNQAVNLYNTKPGTVFDTFDPNQPFNLQGGRLTPNQPFQQFQLNKSRAGASVNNISVNTDKSYFGNVAEGLAKNDVALIDAGRSAPDRIASSQRVKQILAANPITGTGAEARLSLTKALSTAGLIDGKTVADTETLASMLASQTLDAIKTSGLGAGQGFTDKDRQFLERAKSGNIEMSAATLGRLADLNEHAARTSIRRANSVIQKLRTSPEAGRMGQQLDAIEEPAAPTAPAAPARQQVFDAKPPANPSNKGKVLTDTVTGQRFRSNGLAWIEEK